MSFTLKFFHVLSTKIFCAISYQEVYNLILEYLKQDKSNYVTVNNVHTVVEAAKNKDYARIINKSLIALPDGRPLSIIANIKGFKDVVRIFGPTFFEKTIDWGQKENLKHFFFGSNNNTIEKISKVIKSKYPNAIISGMISPPFREFTEKENDLFINQMNNSGADLIWVSLGAPKQEMWIYNNYHKLNKGIMIGIGAGFNYLAGDLKHAPHWMKNLSLEWLYRFMQEPKRLWRRYLITNSQFIIFVLMDFLKLKRF